MHMSSKKPKLTFRQYLHALAKVAKRSFQIAPSAAIIQVVNSVMSAVLPIVTTYFAALTTTALAEAYAGEDGAADRSLLLVVVTALVGILTLAWNSISQYISQKTQYILDTVIEDELMMQFSRLPFALYDDKDVVDMYEKAQRFSFYFGRIFNSLGAVASGVLSTIGACIALLFVSPGVALAVVIAIVPGILLQIRLARQQMKHWETNITLRRRQNNMGWMLREPRFMAEVRVYGLARQLIAYYAEARDKDEKARLGFELRMIWKRLAADVVAAAVELGSLVWIALQIINRAQPIGQFLYVQQMVSRAIGSASSLAAQLGSMDEDLANLVDYQAFMELSTEDDSGKELASLPQEITLNNISFRYPKTDKMVLDGVSIRIPQGQHVAVVGENGAGKSTLVKLLMGLYQPTSGEILLDNQKLQNVSLSSWHRQIALLGQEFALYGFATIRENITFGSIDKRPTKRAIDEAMEKAEFTSVTNKLKHGVDTYVWRWMAEDDDDTTATELSGGQQQRLALARSFYRNSPIIILDEPTSAIDALAESRIFKRLFLEKNKTIITISHRLTTVEKADIIYMMESGKVVEQGTHKELVAKQGKYYQMFESQIHIVDERMHS